MNQRPSPLSQVTFPPEGQPNSDSQSDSLKEPPDAQLNTHAQRKSTSSKEPRSTTSSQSKTQALWDSIIDEFERAVDEYYEIERDPKSSAEKLAEATVELERKEKRFEVRKKAFEEIETWFDERSGKHEERANELKCVDTRQYEHLFG